MKLRIHHRTAYRYARDVILLPHRLLLCPRPGHELQLLANSLDVSPEAQLAWMQDVYGNVVTIAEFHHPAAELVIESELLVELTAPAWPVFRIAPEAHGYPFAYAPQDVEDLGALRRPAPGDDGVRVWTRDFVPHASTDTLTLLKNLNSGIAGPIAYRTREEEGTQTPSQTLAAASGSCRDIATLFIEAVRVLGFGARAVSGYFYDPDASPDVAGSTHAWAEVYLPQAEWIAFDPTHRRVGGACLIPVAVGHSNRQILPITGGYSESAGDFTGMEVGVRVVEEV